LQESDPTRSPKRTSSSERVQPSKPVRNTDFPGSRLLVARSASILLDRLADGDPLELGPRLVDRMVDQAICVDGQRLIDMVVARVAHDAMGYEGEPSLDEFLNACIDKAIDAFLIREAEAESAGAPLEIPEDPYHVFFSQVLGVELPMARKISIHFHYLPLATRRAFQAIFVDQMSINRWVAEGNGPPERVMAQLKYALEMMSTLGATEMCDPDLEWGRRKDDD
jgi:hypothetical protein